MKNTLYKLKLYFISKIFKKASLQLTLFFLNDKITKNKLVIDGKEYPYLFHSYNNMGISERSVEMPIILHYLKSFKFNNILEIGNVTNYYNDYFYNIFPNKTVIDKIEYSYQTVTSDIANYWSEKKFDFIFSISTFEHMDSDLGRNKDYNSGSSKHITVAADNIVHCYENLLSLGGLMVITAPMGYTKEWDFTFQSEFLDTYGFKNIKRKIFRRVNEQEWILDEKISKNSSMQYGTPYPYANYISVIEIIK